MNAQKALDITSLSSKREVSNEQRSLAAAKVRDRLKGLHAVALDSDLGMLCYLIEMAMLEATSQAKKKQN